MIFLYIHTFMTAPLNTHRPSPFSICIISLTSHVEALIKQTNVFYLLLELKKV